jgi:glycosyltransferase involved in cell wall biosynthesis
VASRVRFASRLTDAELDRVYAGSTLLATSRLEGFGQPPIEAILAAGRVVAARIPSYLETVGDIASFATDATPAAFADAVEAAVAPPSDDARQMLAVRFGADAATTALRAAYERFA